MAQDLKMCTQYPFNEFILNYGVELHKNSWLLFIITIIFIIIDSYS